MIDLTVKTEINLGLILTPKLDVSLKILMMNIAELEEKINEISETNPFIKMEDDIQQKKAPTTEYNTKELDETFKERFSGEEYIDPFENIFKSKKSFFEAMLEEANLSFDLTEKELKIAKTIIYNLNDRGFLDLDVESFIKENNIEMEMFENVRRKIMALEPEGCGTKDVYEFLHFQAETLCKDMLEPVKQTIDYIKNRKVKNIWDALKKLKMDKRQAEMVSKCFENMSLYPLQFTSLSEHPEYIEPDIVVEEINGTLVPIVVDPKTKISIDTETLNLCLSSEGNGEYVKDKYREAMNFIEAMEGRKKTLLKIMEAIVKKQESFFRNGEIKALTRKDVAEETGFSISTVTRAVANKHFLFRGSVYPIAKLFSNSVSGTSKSNIQQIIKNLIDNEDKKKPLGDEEIKKRLEKMGFHITRRAVTKYRNQMNIPKSRDRKI